MATDVEAAKEGRRKASSERDRLRSAHGRAMVKRDAARDANARAEQTDNKRIAVADDFNLAADTQPHRHEPLNRGVAPVNLVDDGPSAGGELIEAFSV